MVSARKDATTVKVVSVVHLIAMNVVIIRRVVNAVLLTVQTAAITAKVASVAIPIASIAVVATASRREVAPTRRMSTSCSKTSRSWAA
mgnify:CR=1 FL=1